MMLERDGELGIGDLSKDPFSKFKFNLIRLTPTGVLLTQAPELNPFSLVVAILRRS